MKYCSSCKKEKDLSEFYKNRAMKDGYAGQCKDCRREYRRTQRARALKRLSDRKWYRRGGSAKIREYQKTQKFKQIKRMSAVKYRRKYPEKLDAHNKLIYAVKSGKIQRPDRCSTCGAECVPEGHHHKGYEPEYHLEVIWLCNVCHQKEHRRAA